MVRWWLMGNRMLPPEMQKAIREEGLVDVIEQWTGGVPLPGFR